MDIKLKDLLRCISTTQEIKIINNDNEEQFYPRYGDFQDFNEFYVIEVFAYEEDRLTICIKGNI